jgi:hypothetical protein
MFRNYSAHIANLTNMCTYIDTYHILSYRISQILAISIDWSGETPPQLYELDPSPHYVIRQQRPSVTDINRSLSNSNFFQELVDGNAPIRDTHSRGGCLIIAVGKIFLAHDRFSSEIKWRKLIFLQTRSS